MGSSLCKSEGSPGGFWLFLGRLEEGLVGVTVSFWSADFLNVNASPTLVKNFFVPVAILFSTEGCGFVLHERIIFHVGLTIGRHIGENDPSPACRSIAQEKAKRQSQHANVRNSNDHNEPLRFAFDKDQINRNKPNSRQFGRRTYNIRMRVNEKILRWICDGSVPKRCGYVQAFFSW